MRQKYNSDKKISYRLLEPSDKPFILDLMQELKVPVAGLYNKNIYNSFINFSMENNKIIFVVAVRGNLLVGLSVTIIDWKVFWREFFTKNIIQIFNMMIDELKTYWKIKKSNMFAKNADNNYIDISMYLSDKPTNRSWKDSSPFIAKVLYVAVKKEFRKHGIGRGLYDFRMQVLKERGVKRLDSKINRQNIAPIKLAFNEGRQIIHDKHGMLFTTLDIT